MLSVQIERFSETAVEDEEGEEDTEDEDDEEDKRDEKAKDAVKQAGDEVE